MTAAEAKAAAKDDEMKPLSIAKTFDSFDATLRLAAMTDQTEDFRDYITQTQKMRAYRGKIEATSPLAAAPEAPKQPRIMLENPEIGTQTVPPSGGVSYFVALSAIVVLALALALTAAATYTGLRTAEARDGLRFQSAVQRTQVLIENRMESYISLLRATSGLFAANDPPYLKVTFDDEPASVYLRASLVSGGYFTVLGMQPAMGRLLTPDDDRVDGEGHAAVLSHAFWQNRFAGSPDVLSEKLVVNGQPMTIVGAAPEGFTGTTVLDVPKIFVPLTMALIALENLETGGVQMRKDLADVVKTLQQAVTLRPTYHERDRQTT